MHRRSTALAEASIRSTQPFSEFGINFPTRPARPVFKLRRTEKPFGCRASTTNVVYLEGDYVLSNASFAWSLVPNNDGTYAVCQDKLCVLANSSDQTLVLVPRADQTNFTLHIQPRQVTYYEVNQPTCLPNTSYGGGNLAIDASGALFFTYLNNVFTTNASGTFTLPIKSLGRPSAVAVSSDGYLFIRRFSPPSRASPRSTST